MIAQIRGRLVVKEPHRIVVDVKTTRDASRAEFAKSIANLDYHVQAAWNQDALGAEQFITIAVEESASASAPPRRATCRNSVDHARPSQRSCGGRKPSVLFPDWIAGPICVSQIAPPITPGEARLDSASEATLVPTVALNSLPGAAPPFLFQYSLDPEQEARAVVVG